MLDRDGHLLMESSAIAKYIAMRGEGKLLG